MHKTYEVSFKALDGDAPGRFEALVSVFGNVDVQGDRVIKGAFKNTIDQWRRSGDSIPVIWSHDWGNPFAHIGAVDPAKMHETDEGLLVQGELDLTNEFAAQVYSLMKRRLVKEFSFGYRVLDEKTAADGANDLLELEIMEVGPTLKGANPATELRGIKAELDAAADTPTLLDRLDRLEAELAQFKATVTLPTTQDATAVTPVLERTDSEVTATTQEPEGATVQEPDPDEELKTALADLIAKATVQGDKLP